MNGTNMNSPANFWESRYAEPSYAYGKAPNDYFKQQIDAITTPGRLLLLAEGEGRNAVYAAEKGWQVTAVDFSEKARAKALILAEERGVSLDYHVADLAEYDMEANGPWDAIGLIYAHFQPELRSKVHQACSKALKPGGRIILEAFNRNQLGRTSGGPQNIAMLYSKQLLEEDFEQLNILEAEEMLFALNEGAHHVGLAEVVRVLAERSA